MAFANTTISTPDPKQEEKKLKERISFLGKKIDEAESQLSSYKNITTKKEQAEKELVDLEKELSNVKNDLRDAEKEHKESVRNNEVFGASVLNYQKEREDEVRKTQEIRTVLQMELEVVQSQKAQLEKDVAELEKKVVSSQKLFNDLALENAGLSKDNDAVKKSLLSTQKTLLSATEELGIVLHSIEQGRSELEKLNSVVDAKQKQVISLGSQTKSLEDKLAGITRLITEEEEKVRHILEAEKLKITECEGTISLRETWLKEKEESLRKFHAELEKFYGKKININV